MESGSLVERGRYVESASYRYVEVGAMLKLVAMWKLVHVRKVGLCVKWEL